MLLKGCSALTSTHTSSMQAMNTDGLDLHTFIQGIQDRSNSVFGQHLQVKSNKAHIDPCQVCGGSDHVFNKCPNVPPTAKDMITAKLKEPKVHDRITNKCTHCGKTGHTEHKCWEKYPHRKPTGVRIDKSGDVEAKASEAKVSPVINDEDMASIRAIAAYIKEQKDAEARDPRRLFVAGR